MMICGILMFLVGVIRGRPQVCDPIFDTCSERQTECDYEDIFADCNDVETTPCDPDDVFADCNQPSPSTPAECFDSTQDIENAIFSGDTRQAFNDCDPTSSCDKYEDEGYACAPSWTCKNNTIITDGKGSSMLELLILPLQCL
eukprot:TRINITY_DN35912_c0_g1_i1.p1 TRINITY_DN35912_c0_g1~~TRINITY_DN35912_c0_g1_i1.p1  ORF type:complete len:143 (-),score=21.72 TRINITY_DN35912_c0_g1_i1:593-1021(-)